MQKVENDKCDPSKNFETIKNCTGEEEECEGEWFSGPWGKVRSKNMHTFNFSLKHFFPEMIYNVVGYLSVIKHTGQHTQCFVSFKFK